MYYRIYGVMSQSGFHTELFNANTLAKAQEKIQKLDEKTYPFFAITEHLTSGSPAISIYPGVTRDRAPSAVHSLIEFKPNPMQDFVLAESLFTKLKQKKDELEAKSPAIAIYPVSKV